mgnify:CR=1 FL=1
MTKNWSLAEVERQLHAMYLGATDYRMTGFNNWPCKQDLYRVKFLVDEMLENCSTFLDEEEWLREQEAEKIVRILKK